MVSNLSKVRENKMNWNKSVRRRKESKIQLGQKCFNNIMRTNELEWNTQKDFLLSIYTTEEARDILKPIPSANTKYF